MFFLCLFSFRETKFLVLLLSLLLGVVLSFVDLFRNRKLNIAFKVCVFFWWVKDVDVERKNCDYTSDLSLAAFSLSGTLVDLIISESPSRFSLTM